MVEAASPHNQCQACQDFILALGLTSLVLDVNFSISMCVQFIRVSSRATIQADLPVVRMIKICVDEHARR